MPGPVSVGRASLHCTAPAHRDNRQGNE